MRNDIMGGHLTKTHPMPREASLSLDSNGLCFQDAGSITRTGVGHNQHLVPASVVSQPPTRRSLRLAPDLYVYLSYRNWYLARKHIDLELGLDYVSTNRRFSVLHVAVENCAPTDVVSRIMDKGISVNLPESLFDQTPLHILMKSLGDRNSFEILELLLKYGADVNASAKVRRIPCDCE